MTETTPCVGLVGTGLMGNQHTVAWQRLGIPVVVHSRDRGRGEAFAAEHGITAVADLAELLDRVSIVDICTPTDTHAEWAFEAAAKGRHVICEKPLARTPAEGRAMIETCRSAGVGLFPAQVLRFFPAYVRTREAVLSGRIGALRKLRFFRINASPGRGTWFVDVARSGGVLVDLAIHDLDFARWVAGEVTHVVGRSEPLTTSEPGAGPDEYVHASATLTHASGVESEVTGIWDVPGTELRSTFEIEGDEGVLRFDSKPSAVVTDGAGDVVYADDGAVDPYAEQLAEFVAAFEGRAESRVTAEDGLVALTLALAGGESARLGTPVDPASLR
ncbi:Gfo/Idh/MocA family oxidoreductase [Actinopolymorpha sp. B17G11]|uniref:Gfo/Idh/MocA family protein n=1 Tax=unclassified Actinopolymorpha TaxID=2627063 RepID=UPI0032D93C54